MNEIRELIRDELQQQCVNVYRKEVHVARLKKIKILQTLTQEEEELQQLVELLGEESVQVS